MRPRHHNEDGKYILTSEFSDISMDEIIANMVGREIKEKFPRIELNRGKKIFEVKNLNAGRMVRDINLELYEGEIVGDSRSGRLRANRNHQSYFRSGPQRIPGDYFRW